MNSLPEGPLEGALRFRTPGIHIVLDGSDVPRDVVAIGGGSVHRNDLFNRREVPLSNVEGADEPVPIFFPLQPARISSVSLNTAIPLATADIAE